MKISKRELMRIIQEECGMKQAHDKPVVLDVPVLEPAAVKAAVKSASNITKMVEDWNRVIFKSN